MGVRKHTSAPEERDSPSGSRTRRIVVGAALTGALIAGVLALTLPAVAQTGSGDGGTETDDSGAAGSAPTEGEAVEDAVKGRLAAALAPLVTDGTITEDQRDAVIEALWTARRSVDTDENAGRHWGRRHGAMRGMASVGELAELLSLTPEELAAGLRAGDTLADLATDAGVETSAVVDLLVEAATARLDDSVDSGRIESDDRDMCLTAITAAIAARVDGEVADRATVGDACGHDGDRDGDGDGRRHGRGALGRLRFWR